MKKLFFFLLTVVLFSSCTQEENNYFMDQEATEKVVLGSLEQVDTGVSPVFKLQYSNNTYEGGTFFIKIADDEGNIIYWVGQKILLQENGEIHIGGEPYVNIFRDIVPGEQYYFIFQNHEDNPIYTFSVDNGETFKEKGIIPFILEASPNGEISDLELNSFDIQKGNNSSQKVGKIEIDVEEGPIHIERIDWYIQSNVDTPDDIFEEIVIKDENGNILVSNNNIDDYSAWHNLGNNIYRLRLYTDFVVNPGLKNISIYVKNSVPYWTTGGVDVEEKVNIRYLNLAGITQIEESSWEDFEID